MNFILRIIILAGIFASLLIAGFYVRDQKYKNNSSFPPAQAQGLPPPSQSVVATISYGDTGFNPKSIIANPGDLIKMVNNSESIIEVVSAPPRDNSGNTDLNIGIIEPGDSKIFSSLNSGSWGYYNNLNPTDSGTIIIR